jgi:hypothetical protein
MTEVNFQPYVDSVTKSVERSRNSLYVLVVALIATFAVCRNTDYVNWQGRRTKLAEQCIECMKPGNVDKNCPDVIAPFRDSKGLVDQTAVKTYLDELIKIKAGETLFQMPVLGITLDVNDTALLAGIVFVALLFILYANLNRSKANMDTALAIADNDPHKIELLRMNLVLVTPPDMRPRIAYWILPGVISMPLLLEAYLIWRDFKTVGLGLLESPALVQQVLIGSTLMWLMMIWLAHRCIALLLATNKQLDPHYVPPAAPAASTKTEAKDPPML